MCTPLKHGLCGLQLKKDNHFNIFGKTSLPKKCPYSEFFWPGKYGPEKLRIRTLFMPCLRLKYYQVFAEIINEPLSSNGESIFD